MTEESLFIAALDKPTPAERRAFLDAACGGDTALRGRVERLLASDDTSGVLDAAPSTAGPAAAAAATLAAGRVFAGRYRLVRKLGQGGMGEVWAADQLEPVRRPVAVKVVRPGADGGRFELERQALARMDHPHIARVFDAGVADGTPYLAMELVEGEPVTAHARNLPTRDRLELFVKVCRAVQHAHQKGVIHRDLKPSNILVAAVDGAAVPKVIDFGIAKAAGAKLTDDTVRTEFGTVLGTPEYMAPEQIEAGADDVDTRADVYALGAVLYELLAGSPPFPRADYPGGLFDLLRAVREAEPPPPSRRASAPQLRGELDWVVLRCLEKDRGRRYETVNGLARDIERYLADEVVEARPPTAGYRARKFARRNRGPLVAAGLLAVALVGGVVGTAIGLVEARRQRDDANDARARADDEADTARAVASLLQDGLLDRANVRYQDKVVGRNRNVTVRQLLDRVAGRVGVALPGKERTEAALRYTIGAAYLAVGEHPAAEAHLERALELQTAAFGPDDPDTLRTATGLGQSYHARHAHRRAAPHLERALAAYRRTRPADDFDVLATARNLGSVYTDLGRYDEAEPLLAESLAGLRAKLTDRHYATLLSLTATAHLHLARREPAKAAPLVARVRELAPEVLGPDHPDGLAADALYAGVCRDEGNLPEAERAFVRARDRMAAVLGADHPDALQTAVLAAQVINMQNRPDEAGPLLRAAHAAMRAKLGADDQRTVNAANSLGVLELRRGRPADAVPLLRPVAAWNRATHEPDHPLTIATTRNLAIACFQSGRVDEATKLFLTAARGAERRGFRVSNAAEILQNAVVALRDDGRPAEADEWVGKWAAAVRAGTVPATTSCAIQLTTAGNAAAARGDPAAAEPFLRDSLAVREQLAADDYRTALARSRLGDSLRRLGRPADAGPLLLAGFAGLTERAAKIPAASRRQVLREAANRLVSLYEATGDAAAAARWRAERDAHPRESAPSPRAGR